MKCFAVLIVTAVFCQIAVGAARYRRGYNFDGYGSYIDENESSVQKYYTSPKPESRWWTTNRPRPRENYGGYNSHHGYYWPHEHSNSWGRSSSTTERIVSKQELAAMCVKSCPVTGEYNPVCGSNEVTYPNLGRLECEQGCGVDVTLSRSTSCSESVPPIREKNKNRDELVACIRRCPQTDEFNPVCGSNNNTYVNLGQLECEKNCGMDVELVKRSPCTILIGKVAEGPSKEEQITDCIKTCPVVGEYKPVCGSNKQTYMNAERLQCAQNCGVDVKLSRPTSCDEPLQEIPVSTTTARPFINGGDTFKGENEENFENKNNGEDKNEKSYGSAEDSPGEVDNDGQTKKEETGNYGGTQSVGGGDTNVNSFSVGNEGIEGIIENQVGHQEKDCRSSSNPKRTPSEKEILECTQSCILTSEKNPVCGTDDITYANPGRLLCRQFCGVDVQVKKFAPCNSGNTDKLHCVTTCTNNQFTDITGNPRIPGNTGSPSYTVNHGSTDIAGKPGSTGNPATILPLSTQDCMDGCSASNVYQPVCGTNKVTYRNIEMLRCATHCGISVSLLKEAACADPVSIPSKPVVIPIVPPVWTTTKKPSTGTQSVHECISQCVRDNTPRDPTCGSNDVTYNNIEHLTCARQCGVDVRVKMLSTSCEDLNQMSSPDQEENHNSQNQNFNISPGTLENIWGDRTKSSDDEQYQLDERIKDPK